jgi:hypothetical protein
MRWFYQLLLRLHPAGFQREFAGEMLWIFDQIRATTEGRKSGLLSRFDEASASEGVFALFLDGAISLARQWVLRSGSWKVPVAILGGLLQVTFGGLGWLAMEHPKIAAQTAREQFKGEWVGEIRAPGRARKIELRLAPVGTSWVGKVVVDGEEGVARDVRVKMGSVQFGLNVGGSTLWFEGKRALRGGQVSGVVQGLERGTFRLVRE